MDTAPRQTSGKIALGVSLLVLAAVMVFVFARMAGQRPPPTVASAPVAAIPAPAPEPTPEPGSEAAMDRRLGAAPRGYPATPDGATMPAPQMPAPQMPAPQMPAPEMPSPNMPPPPPPMSNPGETNPGDTTGVYLGGVDDAAPK